MPAIALMGPQRLQPTLQEAMEQLGIDGRIAAITAGWEERELEDDELATHLGGRGVNLSLAQRAEQVRLADPDLLRETLAHRDRLKATKALYRVRLGYALDAARDLLQRSDGSRLLYGEQDAAIDSVREIDDAHLDAVAALDAEFAQRTTPDEHPGFAHHREEIASIVDECAAVAIAGGNVGVVLEMLRLFGIVELIGDRPVMAWSAGAMALGERVVLFHDSPPQGRGNAEVHARGLGLVANVLPLPHAHRRLRLEDRVRVGLFARRFAPLACIAMGDGAHLLVEGERWSGEAGIRRLRTDGSVTDGWSLQAEGER